MKDLFYELLITEFKKTEIGGDYQLKIENNTLWIFLEESNGKDDNVNNLLFFPKFDELTGIKYHGNLLKVWLSIEKEIIDYIIDNIFHKIILVGYSHGAGLSIIGNQRICKIREDIKDNVITFAFEPPKVVYGSVKNATNIDNIHIFIHGNDLITKLPPSIFNYHHIGCIYKIGNSETLKYHFATPSFIKNEKLDKIYQSIIKTYNYHYYRNILDALTIFDNDNPNFLNKKIRRME